jgi:hypothetical protein
MGPTSTTTTELRLFNVLISALMLVVGVVVVGVVAYDIYLHPADPQAVGTATIKLSGTSRFEGDIGAVSTTGSNTFAIEGRAPVTVKVPFARADHVVADLGRESGVVKIRVECKRVAKQEASEAGAALMWKVPRDWQEGEPPKDWPKCPL